MPKATLDLHETENVSANVPLDTIASSASNLVWLDPDLIVADPVTNIRGNDDGEKEEKAIARLAATMRENGQIQPITVRACNHGTNKYAVIDGRRRTLAASQIEGFKLAAYVVEMTDEEAYRSAILAAIQRKSLGSVAFARHIKRVRTKYDWQGSQHTDKVKDYFGVSRATITQHEKILALPHEIIERGEREGWAAQTFFSVQKIDPDKREEVLAKAQKKADDSQHPPLSDAKSTPSRGQKGEKVSKHPPTTQNRVAVKPGGKDLGLKDTRDAKKDPKPAKLEHKHVVEAARDTSGAVTKAKPRTREEICQFVEHLMGDDPKRVAIFRKWERGETSDEILTAAALLR